MHITPRTGGRSAEYDDPVERYLRLASAFRGSRAVRFSSEADLWDSLSKDSRRSFTVLCDPRGRQLRSEELARWVGQQRDLSLAHLIFAIGPPDGWSEISRARAGLLLSLGPMTLPHALARLVVAEQIFRVSAILSGHPYHKEH